MPDRYWTGLIASSLDERRVRHTWGRGSAAVPMPAADVVVIDSRSDGIFLVRYTVGGDFAGDTWHRTVAEAKAQADFEYGPEALPWASIPDSVDDPIAFALKEARDTG